MSAIKRDAEVKDSSAMLPGFSATNLEAILITYFLTEWRTDVSSLYVTLKMLDMHFSIL